MARHPWMMGPLPRVCLACPSCPCHPRRSAFPYSLSLIHGLHSLSGATERGEHSQHGKSPSLEEVVRIDICKPLSYVRHPLLHFSSIVQRPPPTPSLLPLPFYFQEHKGDPLPLKYQDHLRTSYQIILVFAVLSIFCNCLLVLKKTRHSFTHYVLQSPGCAFKYTRISRTNTNIDRTSFTIYITENLYKHLSTPTLSISTLFDPTSYQNAHLTFPFPLLLQHPHIPPPILLTHVEPPQLLLLQLVVADQHHQRYHAQTTFNGGYGGGEEELCLGLGDVGAETDCVLGWTRGEDGLSMNWNPSVGFRFLMKTDSELAMGHNMGLHCWALELGQVDGQMMMRLRQDRGQLMTALMTLTAWIYGWLGYGATGAILELFCSRFAHSKR